MLRRDNSGPGSVGVPRAAQDGSAEPRAALTPTRLTQDPPRPRSAQLGPAWPGGGQRAQRHRALLSCPNAPRQCPLCPLARPRAAAMITLAECRISPFSLIPGTRPRGRSVLPRRGALPAALGLRRRLTSRSPSRVRSREETPVKRVAKVPVNRVGLKRLFAASRLLRPGKRLPRRFPPSAAQPAASAGAFYPISSFSAGLRVFQEFFLSPSHSCWFLACSGTSEPGASLPRGGMSHIAVPHPDPAGRERDSCPLPPGAAARTHTHRSCRGTSRSSGQSSQPPASPAVSRGGLVMRQH